jgi:hypothetical protein
VRRVAGEGQTAAGYRQILQALERFENPLELQRALNMQRAQNSPRNTQNKPAASAIETGRVRIQARARLRTVRH